ncbi:MAG: hypothetical protein M1814_000961 [Vezdaea aestivalis]|nr:MAG: hypothetical protein M1814_000961 [Vezdaea aestivalis]
MSDAEVPLPGHWPLDHQEAIPVDEARVWVDGCFDFSHHGHAGAMLQARRLGKFLAVGVHSDEAILENKGPTVMTLEERLAAVAACRWASIVVPNAPYVTSLPWITHYGCHFVVHGDDITSDSGGEDCYRFVKAAGRFKVVRRTPGISTTDIVGRMLLCTKTHFIRSLTAILNGSEGPGSDSERERNSQDMSQRLRDYASDESGQQPGPEVFSWSGSRIAKAEATSEHGEGEAGVFSRLVQGVPPGPKQRVVYVDGGFDLFSSGHIEFLRRVVEEEARQHGTAPYLVAGVHDDEVINRWKGLNYPIMNIFERGLCVLQCHYVQAIVFSAPFAPSKAFLNTLPSGTPVAVYHGPTAFMPLTYDPYTAPREMGIFRQVGSHAFQNVNAAEIVQRIMRSKARYEERQRLKGVKSIGEEAEKLKQGETITAKQA